MITISLELPNSIIKKINGNYFLDLTNKKNLDIYYNYFNKEIDKIINTRNLNKEIHFLHTGAKLSFKDNDIRAQTWFESLKDYKCWLPNYIIRKYFIPSYSRILLNSKLLNLNKLPKIINYVNIVELKNFDKVSKKYLRGYFSARYKNNNIKKYNVIKRTRFLGRLTDCGLYTLNNTKSDAIIISASRLKKSRPKIKILIEITNKYSNDYEFISGVKLSEEYLKYCEYVSKLDFKGYTKFKKLSESYSIDILDLNIPNKFPYTNNSFYKYHKILVKELIQKIVDKKYKRLPYLPKLHYTKGVPRPNHGVLNIVRQGLFTVKLLQIFKKRNTKLFNRVFKNKQLIYLTIIASHFISILRVGEGIKGLTESNYIKMDSKILKNLFPSIDHSLFKDLVYSNQQIYSGIFLKSILNMYNIDEKIIDMISSTIYWYLDDKSFKKFDIKEFNFTKINNESVFIIIWAIIHFGHYTDHCRGPWSEIFDQSFIKLLLNTIKATYQDRIYLFEYIQKILIKTQIKSKFIKGDKCIKKTKNNTKSTKKCCTNMVKAGMYSQKNFTIYSKNYDKLYSILKFNNELNNLF